MSEDSSKRPANTKKILKQVIRKDAGIRPNKPPRDQRKPSKIKINNKKGK